MAKCPYCEKDISLENVGKEVEGTIKKEVMYFCPHCKTVLGFSFFIGGALTGRP